MPGSAGFSPRRVIAWRQILPQAAPAPSRIRCDPASSGNRQCAAAPGCQRLRAAPRPRRQPRCRSGTPVILLPSRQWAQSGSIFLRSLSISSRRVAQAISGPAAWDPGIVRSALAAIEWSADKRYGTAVPCGKGM